MDGFVQFFTANTASVEKSSSKSTHVARPGRQSSRLTHRPWDVNGASGAFSAGTFSTMTSPHPFMPRVFGDYAPALATHPVNSLRAGSAMWRSSTARSMPPADRDIGTLANRIAVATTSWKRLGCNAAGPPSTSAWPYRGEPVHGRYMRSDRPIDGSEDDLAAVCGGQDIERAGASED